MDISRNVARTALARSATWSAIRALNAQTRPSLASRCAKSLKTCRHFTLASSSREAQKHESPANIENKPDEAYSAPVVSGDDRIRIFSFRPPVDEDGFKKAPAFSIFQEFNPDAPADGSNVPIRERMRRFERDVLDSAHTVPVPPVAGPGVLPHNQGMSLSVDTGLIVDDDYGSSTDAPLPAFEDGALVDFGSDRSFLLPGDLVELRTSGNRIEIAIFIRQLELQSQFYTMSGKWLHRQSTRAKFFVPHFVSLKDIEPLLVYLPDKSVPEAVQDKLQKFENALPRSIGGPLITKMHEFQKEADKIYRENATALDGAYQALSKSHRTMYLTLPGITRRLLPNEWLLLPDGVDKFTGTKMPPSAALYAVYRALMDTDAGIKIISGGNFRSWGRFEIVPRNVRDTISVTVNILRLWQKQDLFHRIDSTFGQFIKKAQAAIDKSRKTRAPTIYGQVGPAQHTAGPSQDVDLSHFNAHDLIFIRFIQCWVGWKSFDAGSALAATGSAILRATGRYDTYVLDQSSGWLLLQELGYIKPWDIPTLYRLRLKGKRYQESFDHGVGEGRLNRQSTTSQRLVEINDILENGRDAVADLRLDWKDLRAYCIDDPSAHEIDDAVSLTRAGTDGEYWVHVHVADPASMISHNSALSNDACLQMANTYLPDRVVTMLPDEVVQEKLSLAPKRPTLTFSAKVNIQGEMLDHKITPGIINKVVYLSPATAAVVCGHSGESTIEPILRVGDEPNETGPGTGASRHMSLLDELEQTDKDDLRLLTSLGAARRKHNLLRGGTNLSQLNIEVAVKLARELTEEKSSSILDTKHFLGDPSISINSKTPTKEGDISPLMLLAAEVAAKWCKDRNIPIIYRVSQKHPGKEDPSIFFKKNILPYYLRDEEPPLSLLREYLQSVGSVLPSSVPGPHVPLGVEGFSRCTSPLRRYSDMITHYQIEAALLQEAKTGNSLVGSEDNSYLPFSKGDIDHLIPKQDEADFNARTAGQRAHKEWALQALLRAWKFGEGKTKLPETFKFSVFRVNEAGTGGAIEELGLSAQLQLPKFLQSFQDITVGDVFEVELRSVNPYSGMIWVEALHKVEVEQTEKVGRATKYL